MDKTIQNKIIENIFSDDQITYLKELISSNLHKIKLNNDPERGRDDLDLFEQTSKENTIRQDIMDAVLSHFDEGYKIIHVTFSDYNNNHINPNLPPHKDPNYPDSGLTFDYQLESNVDWPFCIGDDCFTMKDNEAIIFNPKVNRHYRVDQTFKDGEYVRIIFFYLYRD